MRSPKSMVLFVSLWLSVSVHVGGEGRAAADLSPDVAILRQQGAAADRDGLAKLLRDMRPSDRQRQRIAALIAQLGSDDFNEREAATEALIRLPHPPIRELKRAAAGDDAEVRLRARRILANVDESSSSAVLFAACRVIADRKLTGLAPDLLIAAVEIDSAPLRTAARLAMAATVSADDLPALAAALTDEHVEVRIAAVWGVSAVRGRESHEVIEPLLGDDTQPLLVRLAAAESLVLHQHPSGVAALIALLDAEDAAVRRDAVSLLLAASGRQFDFDPDAGNEDRAQARDKWAAWLKDGGRIIAPLAHPSVSWTDYFDHFLVHGQYENARTEFVKGVPKLLHNHFKTVTRTANTVGSVTDRHRAAKWLYPIEGKGERPRILIESNQRLYPIWGTWQQRWRDWIVLNENSTYIQNAGAHGGPHYESRLEFMVVPLPE